MTLRIISVFFSNLLICLYLGIIFLPLLSCKAQPYQPSEPYKRIQDQQGNLLPHQRKHIPHDNDWSYVPPQNYQLQAPPTYYYSATPILLPNQPPIYVYVPHPKIKPPVSTSQNTRQYYSQRKPTLPPLDNDAFYYAPNGNWNSSKKPRDTTPTPQYVIPPQKPIHNIENDRYDWYDPKHSLPKDNDHSYIPVGPPASHGAVDYPFYFDE